MIDSIKVLSAEGKKSVEYSEYKERRAMGIVDALQRDINALEATIRILSNNIRIAIYTETMPKIMEVLKKYEGKQHGEKTAAALRADLQAATGYRVYVRGNGEEITITELTPEGYGGYQVDVCAGLDPENKDTQGYAARTYFIDRNNRISAGAKHFVYDSSYIDNPAEHIAAQQERINAAFAKVQEAQKILEELNSYYIQGINRTRLENLEYHAPIYGNR